MSKPFQSLDKDYETAFLIGQAYAGSKVDGKKKCPFCYALYTFPDCEAEKGY